MTKPKKKDNLAIRKQNFRERIIMKKLMSTIIVIVMLLITSGNLGVFADDTIKVVRIQDFQ